MTLKESGEIIVFGAVSQVTVAWVKLFKFSYIVTVCGESSASGLSFLFTKRNSIALHIVSEQGKSILNFNNVL